MAHINLGSTHLYIVFYGVGEFSHIFITVYYYQDQEVILHHLEIELEFLFPSSVLHSIRFVLMT